MTITVNKEHIRNSLVIARRSTGYSARKVSNELMRQGLDVSHTSILNYEKGKSRVPIATLEALAIVYERPLNWFLGKSQKLEIIRWF